MTLALPLRGNRARYDITVVSHESDPSGKESKRFSRKGYSRVKNIGTKTGAAFIALMIAGLMLLGNVSSAPAAQAGDWNVLNGLRNVICGSAYFNTEPDDRGLGPNTADPNLGMKPESTRLTAYEKYGMAGLKWTVWLGVKDHSQLTGDGDTAGPQLVSMGGGKDSLNNWAIPADKKKEVDYSSFYNTQDTCAPMGDVGATAVGNFLLSVTSWIVHLSNLLFQTATETSSSVLLTLSPTIVGIVSKLKDALYLEFLAPVLMMSALFLAWKGLVKRSSTEAGTAAIWMLGATIAGFAILANPLFLPSIVNTVVSTVSETTIASMTQIAQTNQSGSQASESANLCTVSGSNGQVEKPDITGKTVKSDLSATENVSANAARTSVRQIQCTMWYSFMYTPWVIGEFGVSPSSATPNVITNGYAEAVKGKTGDTDSLKVGPNKDIGVPANIGLGNANTPANWALYELDSKVNYPGSTKTDQTRGMLNVAAGQLYKSDPNNVWKGTSSMNRVTTGTLAMISALGAGAMIAVISMSMIVMQIGLIILTLFSALFLLVGVHPGFGRRIAMGWLESMAGLAMKRIVLSFLLAVMLIFYSAVLSASASVDWLVSMIMVIAVSLGGLSYKDQLTSMFSRISFGGNGGLTEHDMSSHGKRAAGGALRGAAGFAGAATAIGIGAVKGGAGARKNNKELQQKAREEIANRRNSDDPSAGAGDRPNSGPTDGGAPTDSSGAGDRPDTGPNAGDVAGGTGEIDGQGELFPEADVRPKQAPEADPRMAGDIASGQDMVNKERQRLSDRAGINGYRPATEDDGRRAMVAKAQDDAIRENARYNRFQKISATKEKFANRLDATKGQVQRTVGMVTDKPRNAANAVTRSVAKSTPVRAVTAAAEASKAKAARAKEAAGHYHALAKNNSPAYSKVIERHNQNKVVKQERRVENQEVKKMVASHENKKSVAGEAMRQAKARAQSRKRNSEMQKMIGRATRRL